MLKPSAHHSSWTVLQPRVAAQFYLENKGKYILELWGHPTKKMQRREREKERDPRHFGSSFYRFFSPLGLPFVNGASQECCLFYLRSSLWPSDLPLFYFWGLFPSLSFSPHHSGLFFFFFCIGLLWYSCHLFLISSSSVRFTPFLSFIVPIFAWNVPLVSLIFLKTSLVFPILLFASISLHCHLGRLSYLSLLVFETHTQIGVSFLFSFAFHFFSFLAYL